MGTTSYLPCWQINIQHSKTATGHLVAEACAVGQTIPLLLIQEPYTYKNAIRGLHHKNLRTYSRGPQPRACIVTPVGVQGWLVPQISHRDCTAVMMKSDQQDHPILVVSLYCDGNTMTFRDDLSACSDFARQNQALLLLGMDSNSHSTLWGCPATDNRGEDIEDWLFLNGLQLHNDGIEDTFVTSRASSKIDLTVSTPASFPFVTDWKVNTDDQLSDHRRVEFHLNFSYTILKQVQNLRKTNWDLFSLVLDRCRWHQHHTWVPALLDQAVEAFETAITKALHAACPPRMVNVAQASSQPTWWNDDLKKLRADTRKALTVWRRMRTNDTYETYRSARKTYQYQINHSKRQAWRDMATLMADTGAVSRLIRRGDGKLTSAAPTLLKRQDGSTTNTPEETAAILLDCHFPDSSACPPDGTPPSRKAASDECKDADFITPSKVRWALKSFGPYKSAGPTGLKPVVLQHLPDTAIEYLARLYKASIALEYVPLTWRKAHVLMLPKPGKPNYDEVKSFRPISLNSFLLKGLERLVLWELEDNALRRTPFHPAQHAFRKGQSCDTALSEVIDKIESGIMRGRYALGVFLDIQGAFDNVRWTKVIQLMLARGFPARLTRWYEQFLKNRIINYSNDKGVTHSRRLAKGTPQGGVLSPVCWNVIFDDLLSRVDSGPVRAVAYADDLCLLVTGIDPPTLVDAVQEALDKAMEWGREAGLTFHPKKSETILFHRKRKVQLPKPPRLGSAPVRFTDKVKYLGIELQHDLRWSQHINSKIAKVKNQLLTLKTAAGRLWGLSPRVARNAFVAVARPALTYGCHVWGHALNVSVRTKLTRLNRLAGIGMAPIKRSTPTAGMEIIYNMMPLDIFISRTASHTIRRIHHSSVRQTLGWPWSTWDQRASPDLGQRVAGSHLPTEPHGYHDTYTIMGPPIPYKRA